MAAALHARVHAMHRLATLLLKHGGAGLTALPSSSRSHFGDHERTLAASLLQQQRQQQSGPPALDTHRPDCNVPGCKHCQYEARWQQVHELEGGGRQVKLLELLLGGGPAPGRGRARAAGGRRLAWGREPNG